MRTYPGGPIKRGGVTDKLLGAHANLFGDLSANSGNNAKRATAADVFQKIVWGNAHKLLRISRPGLKGRCGRCAGRAVPLC